MLTMTLTKLEKLARFVREHGFSAHVIDEHGVFFTVPYTTNRGYVGMEGFTVRTMSEARDALGY